MFNPYKYKYQANFEEEDGQNAILKVFTGAYEEIVRIPRSLLPTELKLGETFTLTLQPQEAATSDEADSLKELLNELIK
jgi:hypothetical protein